MFGVDLTFLVLREAGGDEITPDAVPSVLELCLSKIEERGLTEQGICKLLLLLPLTIKMLMAHADRVAGATSEVNALREALNNGSFHVPLLYQESYSLTFCTGQRHIDRYTDINAVCGVVKYWFRTLPETVIPETYFEPIIEAARKSRVANSVSI